jgi:hypothetical protein
MRHSPRRRLGARRPVPTLVALVVLVAASLVTLNLTSPGVAQASDDWTSGHGGPRSLDCTGTQPNLRSAYSKYSGGPVAGSPGAYIETLVCYGADPVVGYDVSVQAMPTTLPPTDTAPGTGSGTRSTSPAGRTGSTAGWRRPARAGSTLWLDLVVVAAADDVAANAGVRERRPRWRDAGLVLLRMAVTC